MKAVCAQRSPPVRGMTLVEVVVALAVLSLLVVSLGAAMRGMADSAQRVDDRIAAVDAMLVAGSFLGAALEGASTIKLSGPEGRLMFDAGPEYVAWAAVMPARFGAAGLHAFRLAVEPLPGAGEQRALLLRYARVSDEVRAFPDWAGTEWRVLARDVERLRLGYGGTSLAQEWPAEWPDKDALPPRIRVDVATLKEAWPPLVVPVRGISRTGGGFVIGGSAR